MVRIQAEDFDVATELARLCRDDTGIGALASFIGLVRDMNEGMAVSGITLEHYPGMAERALEGIAREAEARWRLHRALIVHRVGKLAPGDRIVLVAATAAHRRDAFAACEFMMDALKTRGPFWKKESTARGERWVQARASDVEAARRWRSGNKKQGTGDG